LATPRTDEIGDEENYRHKIDRNGESDLVSEVLRAIRENKPNEDPLAESGDSQNQGAARRIVRAINAKGNRCSENTS
jgi:hypothetical protein